MIRAGDREEIERRLNDKKEELNLFNELKWQRVTEQYLDKYIEFISLYFDFIKTGRIKTRIMFTHNVYVPVGLSKAQIENEYFHLYYQFIKHAFGLKYCNPNGIDRIYLTLMLDQIPDKKEKSDRFKDFLANLPNTNDMVGTNISIPRHQIVDIDSRKHTLLQGLDIILGSMVGKLNEKFSEKPLEQRRRGKRTIAKEKLYKCINREIRSIYPNFNVGATTGQPNGLTDRWNHSYRHWKFVPASHEYDSSAGKKKASRKPTN